MLDDHRRLIAAGKTQRWDVVKWAVTIINMALAAASMAVKQQQVSAGGLFSLLAIGVVSLLFFMWEVTRRMMANRSASPLAFGVLCFDP